MDGDKVDEKIKKYIQRREIPLKFLCNINNKFEKTYFDFCLNDIESIAKRKDVYLELNFDDDSNFFKKSLEEQIDKIKKLEQGDFSELWINANCDLCDIEGCIYDRNNPMYPDGDYTLLDVCSKCKKIVCGYDAPEIFEYRFTYDDIDLIQHNEEESCGKICCECKNFFCLNCLSDKKDLLLTDEEKDELQIEEKGYCLCSDCADGYKKIDLEPMQRFMENFLKKK